MGCDSNLLSELDSKNMAYVAKENVTFGSLQGIWIKATSTASWSIWKKVKSDEGLISEFQASDSAPSALNHYSKTCFDCVASSTVIL